MRTPVRKILKAGGGLVWDKRDRRAGKCLSIFVSASDTLTATLNYSGLTGTVTCHRADRADSTDSTEHTTALSG